MGLAVLTEVVQGEFVFGRFSDPMDALADVIGVLVGLVLIRWWKFPRDEP